MISWVATFIAIIAGMLFFAAIVALVLVYKAKKFAREVGINKDDVREVIGSMKEIESTPKTISGMTNLMVPKIVADFPEFDKAVFDDLLQWKFQSGEYDKCTITIPLTFWED